MGAICAAQAATAANEMPTSPIEAHNAIEPATSNPWATMATHDATATIRFATTATTRAAVIEA